MKELVEIINSVVSERGFRKKGQSWYLKVNDVLQIVNLQKSQYGNQFYINFGVFLGKAEIEDKVKSNACHVQFRFNSVASVSENEKASLALDLDSSMSFEDRLQIISVLIEKSLALFSEFNSKAGLREKLKEEKNRSVLVLPGSWEILNI